MTGTEPRGRGWADTWRAPALVAAIAALVFLPSLRGGFVWDDHRFIGENPSVVRPTSWLRFLTDAHTVDNLGALGIVRPLRTIEFAADYAVFGEDPSAFHAHSLLWHAAASALLCVLLRRLLGDARAAVVAGLFWAVHPAQTECVAFISSRGDLAMGACSFAALIFALKSEGYDRPLAASLVFASLAMLYKEAGAALPLLVVALRVTRLSRVPWWPYFAALAAYLGYRQYVQTAATHGVPFVIGGDWFGTAATTVRAFGFYVVETLLPAQSFDWYMTPSTSFADAQVLTWLVVHAAVVGSAVAARRRAPTWTLAVAWFYAFFGPVSNLVISVGIPTCERFMYASIGGVALALGWALVRAPRGAYAATLVAIAALAAGSVARTGMWRSDASLWPATLADHESVRGHNFAAADLRLEALALRDRATKMEQGEERAAALSRTRELLEESLDHAHRAIAARYAFEMTPQSRSDVARYSETLASNICHILRRDEEALLHAERALSGDATPQYLDDVAEYDRALALFGLGYTPQAIAAMRRAFVQRELKPDAEIAAYLTQGAQSCEEAGLFATADDGYSAAVLAATDDAARAEARARLDALRRRPRPPEAGAIERHEIALLDERLARVTKSCPAVRYPPPAEK